MNQRSVDYESKRELKKFARLCDFLFLIAKLESAFDQSQEVDHMLKNNWCGNCEQHRNDCNCGLPRVQFDEDEAYDRWKDSQQYED